MYPILYPADEPKFTNGALNSSCFTTLGVGPLRDAINCDVTEERNGAYELQMVYPANGIHFNEMKEGMLIFAKPNNTSNNQIFRIYDIDRTFDRRVTVYAEHISYELNNYPVVPTYLHNGSWFFVDVSGSPTQLWGVFSKGVFPSGLTGHYDPPIPCENFQFNYIPDIQGHPKYTSKEIEPLEVYSLRALLGGNEGSFLDLWKGEYEFDNFNVKFYEHRGKDNGVTINFGKNMTDLDQEVSLENLYTHVFPYAKKTEYPVQEDQETQQEYADPIDRWIYAPAASSTWDDRPNSTKTGTWTNRVLALEKDGVSLESKYGFKKVKFLDLTGVFESDQDIQESDVKTQCQNYLSTNDDIFKPKITLSVKFQPVMIGGGADSVSSTLEKISLCDEVRVIYPLYGIDEKLEVNKTVYDVLNERYKSIEIGDAKSNFADTIRDQYGE